MLMTRAPRTGDKNLALICSKIAGDESRHEKAYQAFFQKVLEVSRSLVDSHRHGWKGS
jgi:hypothetical protein